MPRLFPGGSWEGLTPRPVFYESYLAHPTGLRMASTCLFLSGLLVGVAVVAVTRHLAPRSQAALTWATIVGVVGGLARPPTA